MNLHDKIKSLCYEQNIAVSRLEKTLDLGNGTIRRWGKTIPAGDKLKRVADFFDVSVDWLLGRTEEKRNNITKKQNKNQLIDGFIDRLIDEGIIIDSNNIDDSTAEMILNIVKAQVALKIKQKEKEGKNK